MIFLQKNYHITRFKQIILLSLSFLAVSAFLCLDAFVLAQVSPSIGSWTFDEGTGLVATDSSGNGNDGILNGPPLWIGGISGNALWFGGGADRVRRPRLSDRRPRLVRPGGDAAALARPGDRRARAPRAALRRARARRGVRAPLGRGRERARAGALPGDGR